MNALESLQRQFKHNKPKVLLAGGMLAVMCLMWGRLLLQGDPRTSTAAPPDQPDATDTAAPPDRGPLPVVRLADDSNNVRDPFAFNANRYRRTAPDETERPVLTETPETPDPAAQTTRLRAELARIDVQSIVTGDPPVVMIDGRVLRVGDTINGFQIINVNHAQRTVDFQKDGITFRVKP